MRLQFEATLKKAEAGDVLAQFNLGALYATGTDVPQDYNEAVKWFTKAAEQGHAGVQFLLGAMHEAGQGVTQDYKEAIRWFTKAAEQGHAKAQFDLGRMYAMGRGVPQDYEEAREWYTRAAEQGDVKAEYNLGMMYSEGQGLPQDYKEAVKWFAKAAEQFSEAAEQEDAEAQFNLGVMYDEGKGVPQDYKEAIRWFTKAAEQGHAEAQNNLGVMYAKGEGVPQDYVEAYKWLNLSAAQVCEHAEKARESLLKRMSSAQIAEGQRLSREFRPSGPAIGGIAEKIVQDYGAVLMATAPTGGCFRDARDLPHPKERIKQALIFALRTTSDPYMLEQLKIGYISLADWQEGVGERPVGLDWTKMNLQADIHELASQVVAQTSGIEKWIPIMKKEQEVLISELQELGLW